MNGVGNTVLSVHTFKQYVTFRFTYGIQSLLRFCIVAIVDMCYMMDYVYSEFTDILFNLTDRLP